MTDLQVANQTVALTLTDEGDTTVILTEEETTLSIDEVGPAGPAGPSNFPFPFTMTESLIVKDGESFVFIEHTGFELEGVRLWVNVPATGSDIVVDVVINGVSAWTNPADRPIIPAGDQDGGFVTDMDVTMLSPGDRLSVNVVQVGSTTPGEWLTVTIWLRRTSA